MLQTDATLCPECCRPNAPDALTCELCATVLRRPPAAEARGADLREQPVLPALPIAGHVQRDDELERRVWGMPARAFFLAVGLVIAQVFAIGQASWFGWFLSSLAHEMGHSAAAILAGVPSFPAIRLDGHAMAMSGEQNYALLGLVWGGLAYGAWYLRDRPIYAAPLAALLVFSPIVAFTPLTDPWILVMGHGGELVFAAMCFVRVMTGGSFSRGEIERVLYSVLGWYLLAKNVLLFWGIAFRADALIDYYSSGSFGLRNDFDRLAHDHLDMALDSVAFWMLFPCALTFPSAYVVYRLRRSAGEHY